MFTEQQRKDLDAPLGRSNVKTRKQGGRNLSYIEGWHAIAEANRIFGFDCWSRETLEMRLVAEKERSIGERKDIGWGVSYLCRVRITVFSASVDGTIVQREGIGSGHGIDRDLGQAHESAAKEAETDAMKRALSTFGNQFGLALYDRTQENVVEDRTYQQQEAIADRYGERRGEELTRAAATRPIHDDISDRTYDEQQKMRAAAARPNGNGTQISTGEERVGPEDLVSPHEATTGVLKASYLSSCRDFIRKAGDANELRKWWFDENSKKARDDFALTAAELKDLSQFCKARIDVLMGKV